MKKPATQLLIYISFLLLSLLGSHSASAQTVCAAPNDLGGNVFRDLDGDGASDNSANLSPVLVINSASPGITVSVYEDGNTTPIATTMVQADGTYNFQNLYQGRTGDAANLRVEFTGLPDPLSSTVQGVDNDTAVQFYSAATCSADYGAWQGADYCGTDPGVALSCFVGGDANTNAQSAGADSIAEFAYSKRSVGSSITGAPTNVGPDTDTAFADQTGTVWGITYHRETNTILSGAALRRHSGTYEGPVPGGPTPSTSPISLLFKATSGTDDSGAVWLDGAAVGINADVSAATNAGTDLDPANALTSTLTALPSNSARDLGDPTVISEDNDAFRLAGKIGYGDMEMSADDETVYVVNLADRSIYAIDYDSVTNPQTATFSSIAIPQPTCTNGFARPWGLGEKDNVIYAGVVCSGELETDKDYDTQNTLNLHAYVYAMTPDADPAVGTVGTFNPTPVLSFPLDYDGVSNNDDKGCPSRDTGQNPDEPTGCRWSPWLDVWDDDAIDNVDGDSTRPSPILSDIVIDEEGYMYLGFVDRYGGLQAGWNNLKADGSTTNGSGNSNLVRSVVGGDTLLAAPQENGTWTLESNGTASGTVLGAVNSRTTTDTPDFTSTQSNFGLGEGGANSGQGPGGGEFFGNEFLRTFHAEVSQGGLAYLPGSGEVGTTAMDPIRIRSAGVIWMDFDEGARTGQNELLPLQGQGNTEPAFAKSGSLGDLTFICGIAPLEIGNRVWEDADLNGIQDPGEDPIASVVVQLYVWNDANGNDIYEAGELGAAVMESGNPVTASTNADGEYYFGPQSGSAEFGFVGADGLMPNTKYVVAIDPTQAALTSFPTPSPISATTAGEAVGEDNSGTSAAFNGIHDSDGLSGIETDLVIAPLETGFAGENDHTHDFGFGENPVVSIGSVVWLDANGDGMQGTTLDGGTEPGIAGATVTLLQEDPMSAGMFLTAFNDASGNPVMSQMTGVTGA
ncbi:MAG: SdrD B-like domain-containing protein, partial [Pseudomonadota bacterium]